MLREWNETRGVKEDRKQAVEVGGCKTMTGKFVLLYEIVSGLLKLIDPRLVTRSCEGVRLQLKFSVGNNNIIYNSFYATLTDTSANL